jgi:tetratricopeptide (TPR) repeat protein
MRKKFLLFFVMFFISSNLSYAKEKEDIFALKQTYEDGFYQLVISGVKAFIRKYPNSAFKEKALFLKGASFYNLKKYPQAIKELKPLINSKDKEIVPQVLFYLGKIYQIGKDYKKAENYFEKIVTNFNKSLISLKARNEIAVIYYKKNNLDEAKKIWEELYSTKGLSKDIKGKIAINLIKCYIKSKNYNLAEKIVKDLSKEKGKKGEFFYYMGEIQREKGNYKKAREFFEKITQANYPQAEKAKLKIAWCYIGEEKFEEAINLLQQLIETMKTNRDEITYALAYSNYKKSLYEQAYRYYLRLINKYPKSSWREKAFLDVFDCFYNLSRYSQAKKIADEFFQDYPNSKYLDDFHYNLGWLYYKKGDYKTALSEFQWVIENSPDTDLKINSYCRIGDIFSDEGKIDNAIEAYNLVLKQYPDSLYAEYAQFRLGLDFIENKKFDSAILSLRAVLVNFPNSSFADKVHYHLASAYFKKGDYENALDEINILIKEFPKTSYKSKSLLLKALLLYNTSKYKEALEFLDKNMNKIKDINYAHFLRAQILYALDKLDKTEEELTWLIQNLKNKNLIGYIYFQLAEIYYNRKNWDKALEYFEKADNLSKDEQFKEQARYWQGWCYYNKKELKQASIRFLELFNKNSKKLYKEAGYYASLIFMEMGRDDKALELLQQLSKVKDEKYRRLAFLKIGDIYKNRNNLEKALQFYKEVEGSYDEIGTEAIFKEAEVYEILGDTDKAILYYIKIPSLYKSNSKWINKARLRSARLLEKEGKIDEAKKIYLELLKKGGEEGIYAKERLELIEKSLPR